MGTAVAHNVIVHVPPGFTLAHDSADLPHDFDGYSVTQRPDGLVNVHVGFASGAEQLAWRLQFRRLAG